MVLIAGLLLAGLIYILLAATEKAKLNNRMIVPIKKDKK